MISIKFNVRVDVESTTTKLRIRLRDGSWEKTKSLPFKIDKKHFNYQRQELALDSIYYDWFNKIKSRIPDVKKAMYEGQMDRESALQLLVGIDQKNATELRQKCLDKQKKSDKYKVDTILQRMSYINWVENNTRYNPLTELHLRDKMIVEKIANAVYSNPNNKIINSANNHLRKLDDLCGFAFGFRPFAAGDHIKKDVKTKRTEVLDTLKQKTELHLIGNNNRDKGQDVEAVAAYLLAYCLCIDGKDLSKIDLQNVSEIKNNQFDKDHGAYNQPIYLKIRRGKNEAAVATVRYNAYPIPRLHQLLKLSVLQYRPKEGYIGEDPHRIYNWQTYGSDGNHNWKNVGGAYTKRLQYLLGTTFKTGRHTFGSNLENLAVPDSVKKYFVKHSLGKETFEKFYLNHPQMKLDFIQAAAIDKQDILTVWKFLLTQCVKKDLLPAGFEITELDKQYLRVGSLLKGNSWQYYWDRFEKEKAQSEHNATIPLHEESDDVLGL